jgi:hypothetical protein
MSYKVIACPGNNSGSGMKVDDDDEEEPFFDSSPYSYPPD